MVKTVKLVENKIDKSVTQYLETTLFDKVYRFKVIEFKDCSSIDYIDKDNNLIFRITDNNEYKIVNLFKRYILDNNLILFKTKKVVC